MTVSRLVWVMMRGRKRIEAPRDSVGWAAARRGGRETAAKATAAQASRAARRYPVVRVTCTLGIMVGSG
jgi:hypothetical protein